MNREIDYKAIGRRSKNKGKTGERELANKLKDYGYNVRRSVQYNGKQEEGQPDLVGLEGIHVECKRVEKLNIYNAIDQAKRDCIAAHKDELPFSNTVYPTVFHRKNNCEWLVTMRLDDWINLYREYTSGINQGR